MKINILNEKIGLDHFICGIPPASFLQSWEWGKFQKKAGCRVLRLGAEEDGNLLSAATLIKKPLFFGQNYFYCPRGPVFSPWIPDADKQVFFQEIEKTAKKENAVFLRFEPADINGSKHYKGQCVRTIDVQPSKTIILDLAKSEDELLNGMHQKTRYNIRLSEKKGVIIREAKQDEFKDFWCLMDETCKRDSFRSHEGEYYDEMLKMDDGQDMNNDQTINETQSAASGQYLNGSMVNGRINGRVKLKIKLFFAEYNGKVVASNIVGFFGDTVTYIHGASGNESRNVMAPYLLQWELIKLAKREGYKFYDFYGIDEIKWPGVTRFKRGFGGREKTYPGTFDLVFDESWYTLYKVVRKLRRWFSVL